MIESILVYVLVLKGHSLGWIHWIWAGILAAVVPYIISLIIKGFNYHLRGIPVMQVITGEGLAVFFLQLVFALGIFYYLDKNEASFTAWITIGLFGGVGLAFIIPYLVTAIL